MRLTEREDKAWAETRSWLQSSLDDYQTPRLSDIAAYAQPLGLSRTKVIQLVKKHFESYRDTGRPVFPLPRKRYRSYVTSFFYTVSADLAFFGKKNTELRSLGVSKTESNGCLILKVLGSQFVIAVPLGPKGKSADGLVTALDKAFDMYQSKYGTFPSTILMDDEPGMSSTKVLSFLNSKATKLFTYKFSKNKSLLAEQTIRNLRQSLGTLKRHHADEDVKWHRVLQKTVDYYNSRPIEIDGIRMTFAPKDINAENFHLFQDELNEKLQYYSILGLSIDTRLLKYKYPLNTRVKIKKRALSASTGFDKLSQNPLDQRIWIIKRRGAHVTKNMSLVKTVFLEMEQDPKITTQQEEEALVEIL